MKMSELSVLSAVNYLRLDYGSLDDSEKDEIEMLIRAAKDYVKSYTGLSDDEVDEHEDITVAALILVQDMFDNRSRYVQNTISQPNRTVETILNMHCVNLI